MLCIYLQAPAPLTHFLKIIFHYPLIHVTKGLLGKVTHVRSRQPTQKQNTKSPASNDFAVFWVTTSCGLVRGYRRAYVTVTVSLKTEGRQNADITSQHSMSGQYTVQHTHCVIHHLQGLSGVYPIILNISRTGQVALM
jgi:hypothetical protein